MLHLSNGKATASLENLTHRLNSSVHNNKKKITPTDWVGITVFSGQESWLWLPKKHLQSKADGSKLCQLACSMSSPAEDPERKENTCEF